MVYIISFKNQKQLTRQSWKAERPGTAAGVGHRDSPPRHSAAVAAAAVVAAAAAAAAAVAAAAAHHESHTCPGRDRWRCGPRPGSSRD